MKHITLRRLRALSLSLGLVLCFGLFAGCSSQDSSTSQDVLGLIKVSGEQLGQTVVMITHNEEIAQMAGRIIRLEDGRICGGDAV